MGPPRLDGIEWVFRFAIVGMVAVAALVGLLGGWLFDHIRFVF
jgi:hypothetical protein